MMFCKSISLLTCIFVAVATATDYNEPNSIAGLRPLEAAEAPAATHPHSDRSRRGVATAPSVAVCPNATFNELLLSLNKDLPIDVKGARLITAAKDGALQDLQRLLAAGADVGARDEKKNTALHWAAWEGQVEEASCLVAAGAEVDAANWDGNTPLHWAAWAGRTDVVRLLAAASANPNARNADGDTPLHLAAEHGRVEAALALLDAGADRRARNNKGRSPLDRARQFKQQHWIDVVYNNQSLE